MPSPTPTGPAGPPVLPPDLLDPIAVGPWTRDGMDLLVGLGGTPREQTNAAGDTYQTFEWGTHLTLLSMSVWVLVLAYQDITAPADAPGPERWVWLTELWDTPDESGTMLAQHQSHNRTEVIDLLVGLFNVATHLKPTDIPDTTGCPAVADGGDQGDADG